MSQRQSRPNWQHPRHVAKSMLMPGLAARFVSAPHGPGFRRTVAGQALSWGGDLALIGDGRRAFLAGVGSFLAAQVAYVSAYRSRSSSGVLGTAGRRRFLTGGAAASLGMALAAGRGDRALAVPVAVYGVTLTTMVTAAAAVDPERGRGRILAGASLFLLSDTLIGVRRFLADDDSTALQGAVMASYAAAQWCIGDGMAGA